MTTGPRITADDLQHALRLSLTTLRTAAAGTTAADWQRPAGTLTWSCWETVEHLADDLFAYAAQIGLEAPPLDREVPFLWERRREGGPANVTYADPAAGTAGLLQVLESCGAMLVALVRTAPADRRSYHGFGISDPEGFAAMGIVEILLHTHDIASGLGAPWAPPAGLCDQVLTRLFPDAPTGTDRWPTLLWATGRGELPGQERRTSWRWYAEVRDAGEEAGLPV
ncbi:DinB family protein [Streptomyces sp. ISL-36]|uniref:DinB family protein n=1 Tax=Streptomyces sp. ISL-36 TaxID=2819182 RepID=UPI0020355853|nr:DinB family protein [Streptomyces sp. ISL-36]